MNDNLTISKENGTIINAKIVSSFLIPDIQKQYIITTTNELDPSGLIILNVSEVKATKLEKIYDDQDWDKVKGVMRTIISSSAGTFKYMDIANAYNASSDYSRTISVQGMAKDQLIKDYTAKKPITQEIQESLDITPANPALSGGIVGGINEVVNQGIVETQETLNPFQQVNTTQSPIDLIVNQPIAPAVEPQPVNNTIPMGIPIQQPIAPIAPVVENIPQQPVEQIQQVQPQVIETVQPAPIMEPIQTQVIEAAQPVVQQQMVQQAIVQPAIQEQVMNTINNMPTNGMELDKNFLIAQAKQVFMDSATILADVVIKSANEEIIKKEEELKNREIIVSQREMAVNKQTGMM